MSTTNRFLTTSQSISTIASEKTLSDIDNLLQSGGLQVNFAPTASQNVVVTDIDFTTTQTDPLVIDLSTIGTNNVDLGKGNVDSGTLRATIADDDHNLNLLSKSLYDPATMVNTVFDQNSLPSGWTEVTGGTIEYDDVNQWLKITVGFSSVFARLYWTDPIPVETNTIYTLEFEAKYENTELDTPTGGLRGVVGIADIADGVAGGNTGYSIGMRTNDPIEPLFSYQNAATISSSGDYTTEVNDPDFTKFRIIFNNNTGSDPVIEYYEFIGGVYTLITSSTDVPQDFLNPYILINNGVSGTDTKSLYVKYVSYSCESGVIINSIIPELEAINTATTRFADAIENPGTIIDSSMPTISISGYARGDLPGGVNQVRRVATTSNSSVMVCQDQIGLGVSIDLGSGDAGPGTQRVAIASDDANLKSINDALYDAISDVRVDFSEEASTPVGWTLTTVGGSNIIYDTGSGFVSLFTDGNGEHVRLEYSRNVPVEPNCVYILEFSARFQNDLAFTSANGKGVVGFADLTDKVSTADNTGFSIGFNTSDTVEDMYAFENGFSLNQGGDFSAAPNDTVFTEFRIEYDNATGGSPEVRYYEKVVDNFQLVHTEIQLTTEDFLSPYILLDNDTSGTDDKYVRVEYINFFCNQGVIAQKVVPPLEKLANALATDGDSYLAPKNIGNIIHGVTSTNLIKPMTVSTTGVLTTTINEFGGGIDTDVGLATSNTQRVVVSSDQPSIQVRNPHQKVQESWSVPGVTRSWNWNYRQVAGTAISESVTNDALRIDSTGTVISDFQMRTIQSFNCSSIGNELILQFRTDAGSGTSAQSFNLGIASRFDSNPNGFFFRVKNDGTTSIGFAMSGTIAELDEGTWNRNPTLQSSLSSIITIIFEWNQYQITVYETISGGIKRPLQTFTSSGTFFPFINQYPIFIEMTTDASSNAMYLDVLNVQLWSEAESIQRVTSGGFITLLSLDGAGVTTSATGDYSGVGNEVDFFFTFPSYGLIYEATVFIEDAGISSWENYGAIAGPLAVGLQGFLERNITGRSRDLFPFLLVSNASLLILDKHVEFKAGGGDDAIIAKYPYDSLPQGGLYMGPGDKYGFTLNDDFSGLVNHQFLIRGWLW